MRFCSLGSGSRGNAHIVEHGGATILLDCGFSYKTLKKRLAARFISPSEINAVFISHEHNDHTVGLKTFAKLHDVTCYMSAGTARALNFSGDWHCLTAGEAVAVDEIQVRPVPVPHDVSEPIQFVVDNGVRNLAVFTDLGHVSRAIHAACAVADMLVIECNYDEEGLRICTYPEQVKRRIAGDYGHLSNAAAAAVVAASSNGARRHIVAAHISRDSNTPELVQAALKKADPGGTIHVATQDEGTGWISV